MISLVPIQCPQELKNIFGNISLFVSVNNKNSKSNTNMFLGLIRKVQVILHNTAHCIVLVRVLGSALLY